MVPSAGPVAAPGPLDTWPGASRSNLSQRARVGETPAIPRQSWPSHAAVAASRLASDPADDLSRVSAQLPPADAALSGRLYAEAGRLAELRGWSPRTLSLNQQGLRILAAVHGPGEQVRASTVRQLTARNMPFPHIIDVLAGIGVLENDRPDTLALWLDGQLAGLPDQIRAELGSWLSVLRHGGPAAGPAAAGPSSGTSTPSARSSPTSAAGTPRCGRSPMTTSPGGWPAGQAGPGPRTPARCAACSAP